MTPNFTLQNVKNCSVSQRQTLEQLWCEAPSYESSSILVVPHSFEVIERQAIMRYSNDAIIREWYSIEFNVLINYFGFKWWSELIS